MFKSLRAGLVVGTLIVLGIVGVSAQGPAPAQIQQALRAFLQTPNTWTALQTFSNGIVVSSCTGCGGGGIGGSIASTQVAFGTGVDTIGGSNEFTWDNTNTLTLGATDESFITNAALGGIITIKAGFGDDNNDGGILYLLGGTAPAGSGDGHVIITGGAGGSQLGSRIDVDGGQDYGSRHGGDLFIRGGNGTGVPGGTISLSSGSGTAAGNIEMYAGSTGLTFNGATGNLTLDASGAGGKLLLGPIPDPGDSRLVISDDGSTYDTDQFFLVQQNGSFAQTFLRFNGTRASPTPILNGQVIGTISWSGFVFTGGTWDQDSLGAQLTVIADSLPDTVTGALPGRFSFQPGPSNEEVLRLRAPVSVSMATPNANSTVVAAGQLEVQGDTLISNGKALKTDTTTAHTAKIQVYDVNGTAYRDVLTLTNGDAPIAAFTVPTTGSLTIAATSVAAPTLTVSGLTTPANKPVCFDASGNLYAGTNTAGVLSCP